MMFMCDRAKSVWQLLLFWEAAPAFFFAKSPLSSIFAAFPILYVWEAVAAFFYTFSSLCLLTLHHNTNIASHVCRYKYTNNVEPLVGIASQQIKCR